VVLLLLVMMPSTNGRIVVLVKSAVDEAELRADASGHPLFRGAARKMSNFDKNGVEEALRLSEAMGGTTVTVVMLGGPESTKAIKEALAMGATRAVHVVVDSAEEKEGEGRQLGSPDALCTAYCLAQAIRRTGPADVVVCSEGASDTYVGEVGGMVAEFLGMPFLAYARRVELVGEGKIRCEQAFEGRTRVSEARLPAVLSVVSGSNVPRYPTLLQVMAAGKKPIEQLAIGSLVGEDSPATGIDVLDISLQVDERKRVIFEGSAEEASRKLVDALRQEGGIL
jgi:electron transfer flavoprotein beta subunit